MDSFELLQRAADILDRMGVSYLVTGSMATITYGEARFTNDVDIVADFQPSHIESLCAAFSSPNFYLSRAAVEDAVRCRSQFNVIHPTSGLKIDFMVPRDDEFNRSRFSRGQMIPTSEHDTQARFASAEDVILRKLEYYREGQSEKHVRDIKGVLRIQGGRIDFNYLNEWADKLGVTEQLDEILGSLGADTESS